MRLWHKDLIMVLPKQQLLGQWRECCLIAKNLHESGTPNHILVNPVTEYSLSQFIAYCQEVCCEMESRGYHADWSKIRGYFPEYYDYVTHGSIFPEWHNERYLDQCYMNLQEKYDCGGIPEDE